MEGVEVFEHLTYRPFVPKEGMQGVFDALVKDYGSPNHSSPNRWPIVVLEAVCERGRPIAVTFTTFAPTRMYQV